MSTRSRRSPALRDREPITWPRLCAIATEQLGHVETFADWKGAIVDRILALGFRLPHPAQLDRAIKASEISARRQRNPRGAWLWTPITASLAPAPTPHFDPTIRHRPAAQAPSQWTSIEHLASTTSSACGASRRGSGLRALVCNRPAGHEGDHGMSANPGGAIFVRWAREGDR